MDDFSFHSEAMLSSSRTHGTKRGRRGGSPELSARKRVRTGVDIASLSPAQVAVLSEAAAILQVNVSDLADLPKALSNWPRRLKSDNISSAKSVAIPPQQVLIMEAMPSESRRSSQATKLKSKEQPKFRRAILQDPAPNDCCDLQSFSLGLIPKQIADCFAGFIAPTSRLALPAESQGGSTHYDSGMAMINSTLSLDNSRHPLSPSSLSYALQTPETSNLIDISDADDSHDVFQSNYACNNFMPGAEEWLASSGQPMISECIEPYLTPSSMVYHLGNDMENGNDLISFGGELETNMIQSSSDIPDQGQYFENVEIGLVDQSQPKIPTIKTGLTSGRLIATPRRKFQSADDRQKTAQTRKLTACVRCRMQRIRCYPDPCNPKGACLTCQKLTKPTLHKLPCLRYKLTDIRLFREGSYAAGREWSHRWSSNNMDNITQWVSSDLKKIEVTQDYGPTTLTFVVREFVPVKGDMLNRQWSDGGVTKSVAIPNYAIVDMAAALQVHKDFIISQGPQLFKSTLDYNDRLLWDTYDTAIWFSNESKSSEERELLQMILQLWVTIRMTTRSVRITGMETLGMSSDLMDNSSGMRGKIPIPPVLGAQMQLILNHKLQAPLRSKILTRLQKLTLEQKPGNWFCIYLCTFILLHNCSLLTIHDIGYARKHGIKARYARADMIKELHLGANVLLAHFHYGCKGYQPFALDWRPELSTSMATLDDKQLRFVKQAANYVEYNGPRFKKLRSKRANDSEHYFVAQMYEEEWTPRLFVE